MPTAHDLQNKISNALPGSDLARDARNALDELTGRAYLADYIAERLLASGPLADRVKRIERDIGSIATKADATETRTGHTTDNLASLNKMLGHPQSVVGSEDFGELANLRLRLAAIEERQTKTRKAAKK